MRVVQTPDAAARIRSAAEARAAWIELADRTDAPPFSRPGWLEPWTAAFAPGRLHVLLVGPEDRPCGAVPLLRIRRGWRSPTNGHTPAGPLLSDGAATDALIAARLAEAAHGPIRLDELRLDPARRSALETVTLPGGRVRLEHAETTCITDLSGGAERLRAQLSSAHRKELRRAERAAARLGHVRLEVRTAPEAVAEILPTCWRLEASGWKGREGTAVASLPGTRAFYDTAIDWLARRGWLRLQLLWIDERLAAFQVSVLHRGTLFLCKAGYDDDLRAVGPGKLLDQLALCDAADDPAVREADWLGADGRQQRVWATRTEARHRFVAYPPGASGHAARLADEFTSRAGERARRHLPPGARARLRRLRARSTETRRPA